MEYGNEKLRFKHAFDPAPEAGMFSRHAHHQYELIYFLGGDVRCVIEQHSHLMKQGELAVIPPMQYHFIKLESDRPYERMVVEFTACDARPALLAELFETPRFLDLSDSPDLQGVFHRMEQYGDFEDREQLCRNLLTELICLLARKTPREQPLTPYFNETVTAALHYIDQNLTTLTSPDEIHKALFISRAQLYRSFRAAFGIPPMKYINEKRLLLADARIRGGQKPAHAATACGFGDYSTFFRLYKARFGHPPSERRAP